MQTGARNSVIIVKSWIGQGFVAAMCLIALTAGSPTKANAAESQVTCEKCHLTEASQFSRSVHAQSGFECQNCHGGAKAYLLEPAQLSVYTPPTSAPGTTPATRPAFDHGETFRGKPTRAQVPERCAECHSNVEMMNPYGLRTDQLDRYKTSVHGKTLYTKGDDHVAVCIDCHRTHDILDAKNPASSVYPEHVPDTCGRCHSDGARMSTYGLSSDVVTDYKQSLHGQGLLKQGDLAMPTCATCHGNHAAQPPGYRNIGHVCGQCHQRTATLFKESIHAKFPNFAPCVGCHAGDPVHRPHLIFPVTRSPEQLVKTYQPLWENLVSQHLSREEIDARLSQAMREGRAKLAVELRTVCQRCHVNRAQEGHGVLFTQIDQEAIDRAQMMDETIQRTELQFIKTSGHVEQTGRGIILVKDEAFQLEQARTQLVSLAAIQHTLDEKQIVETAGSVSAICDQIEGSLKEKEIGLRWRYLSLVPIWAFLAIFAGALWIKYKQLRKICVVPLSAREKLQ